MDTDPLRGEHATLSERKATPAGIVADGTMSRDDVRDAVERLNVRLAEIDRTLQAADDQLALLKDEEQRAGIAALNLDRQRALIDRLMTVSLLRAPRGRKGLDPNAVLVAWKG